MIKFLKTLILLLSLACQITCFGCNKSDNGNDSTDGSEIVPEGVDTYGYIKDSDKNPIANVVVSDGFICVTTDQTGLYKLNRNKDARFVTYSLPSGYEVEIYASYKLPKLYAKLQANTAKYNFTLKKLAASETRFDLITIGDPQVNSNDHVTRLKDEAIADINSYTASAGVPCYGITLGDHVNNKWNLFNNVGSALRSDVAGLPVFPTVGNHDYEFPKDTEAQSLQKYEALFGPADYSFNRGDVHVVSMSNVIHAYTASAEYTGGFTESRLEWLRQDLSHVPKDKMVILCVHIPLRNSNLLNGTEVLNMLSEYKSAHIMSAHTHSNFKYIHTVNGKEIVEHVTGTTCGAWWRSTVCTEGSPIGFGIFRIDGSEVTEWTYKSVKHDEDFQIRLYRASDVFTGGGSVSYQFTYKNSSQIIANIWNWDEKWTVDVYENGAKTGSMSRFTGKDVWTTAYHIGVLGNSSSYNKDTDHLFHYTLANPNASVRVEATDRFGRKYEQTVFTSPTSHPGVFHADY